MSKPVRVMPMPISQLQFGPYDGKYAGSVRISYMDGNVVIYHANVEQPKPNTYKNDITETLRRNTYGGYKNDR